MDSNTTNVTGEEVWAESVVDGYLISNYGFVYSKKRSRNLKMIIKKDGYHTIHVRHNEKYRNMFVHRLVALAFIPNPFNKKEVNHIDGNKSNNHVVNLEWCTPSENIKHSFSIGLNSQEHRKNNRKINPDNDVKNVKIIHNMGFSYKQIAILYGVSDDTIRNIITKKGAYNNIKLDGKQA